MDIIHTAEILCVGTELLLGQIVNTNAAFLAQELSLAGVYSYHQTVVGDNAVRLAAAIRTCAARCDLLLITGGLGPTEDDLTMATAALVAGVPMELHEPSYQAINAYFARTGRTNITANNWKQARMPRGAQALPNFNGTAPGAIIRIDLDGHVCHLVLLPGPPSELKPMFRDQVLPWLRDRTHTKLHHVFVRLIGIGESAAETQLKDLIDCQTNPTLAPYAAEGEVIFRITQNLTDDADPDLTEDLLEQVRKRVGAYIYEIGSRTMVEVVADLLTARGETVGLAESCTGGLIASQLTDLPGISRVFLGGIVSYDNTVKINQLGVPEELLRRHGAVSAECAAAMAEGCHKALNSDWGLSVTGIAGPDGGTAEKPVGLVFVAVAGPHGTRTHQMNWTGNRQRIRRISALHALNQLRINLLK